MPPSEMTLYHDDGFSVLIQMVTYSLTSDNSKRNYKNALGDDHNHPLDINLIYISSNADSRMDRSTSAQPLTDMVSSIPAIASTSDVRKI